MYTHGAAVVERPSLTRGRFGVLTAAFLSLSALGLPISARAEPVGGVVTAGQATVTYQGANTNINQSTPSAAINWDSFSVGPGEHTAFTVPDAASVTLNKVIGPNPSEILGRLSSNGQLYLMNPSGIFFRAGSQVDVAALVADTQGFGAIMHEGVINAAGDVTFRAPSITVSGKINAGGTVGMYADVFGNGTLFMPVSSHVGVINMSGVVTAREVSVHGDIVRISGTVDVSGHGVQDGGRAVILSELETRVNGMILAAAGLLGGNGGFIETSSHGVLDIAGAIVDASATYGTAGTWLLDPPDYALDAAAATAITTALASTNVTVETDVIGTGTGNINISASLTIPTAKVLTLNAFNNIVFGAGSQFTVSSGGTLNLRADSTGAGTQGTIIGTSGTHVNGTGTLNMYYRPYTSNGAGSLSYAVGSAFFSSFVSGPTTTRWEILASTADGTQFMTDSNAGSTTHNIFLANNINAWATPITTFIGQIDGNFKTIGNGTYSVTSSNFGLFRTMTNATINNLTIDNMNLNLTTNTAFSNIGVLAGNATGSININNLNITNSNIIASPSLTVNNLNIGLGFGNSTATTGTIQNVNLQGVVNTPKDSSVGGFLGVSNGVVLTNFIMRDIISNVEVHGLSSVGGVIGILNNNTPSASVLIDRIDNYGGTGSTRGIYVGAVGGGVFGNIYNVALTNIRNFSPVIGVGTFAQMGGILQSFNMSNVSLVYMSHVQNFGNISVTNPNMDLSGATGGIVSVNYGSIYNAENYGNITLTGLPGITQVGGIIGWFNWQGQLASTTINLTNLSNSGNITVNVTGATSNSAGNIGGIVGQVTTYTQLQTLSYAVNSGTILVPQGSNIGGIIGSNAQFDAASRLNIDHAVNLGDVTGAVSLGGIGGALNWAEGSSTIRNVANFGTITSNGGIGAAGSGYAVGGMVGFTSGPARGTPLFMDFGSYGNVVYNPATVHDTAYFGAVAGYSTFASPTYVASHGVIAMNFQNPSAASNYQVGLITSNTTNTGVVGVSYDSGKWTASGLTGATGFAASSMNNLTTLGLTGHAFIVDASNMYALPNVFTIANVAVTDLTGAASTALDGDVITAKVAGVTLSGTNLTRMLASGTLDQNFKVTGNTAKVLYIGMGAVGVKAMNGATVDATSYRMLSPGPLVANTTAFSFYDAANVTAKARYSLNDFYGAVFNGEIINAYAGGVAGDFTSASTNLLLSNEGTTKNIVLSALTLTGNGKFQINDLAAANVWKVNNVTAANMDFLFNQNNSAVEIQPSGVFQVKSIALGPTNTINLAFPTAVNNAFSTAQHTITAVGGITGPASPITTTGFSAQRFVNGTGTPASVLSKLTLDIRNSNLAANTVLNLPRVDLRFNGNWNVGTIINALEAHVTAEGGAFNIPNLTNATLNIKGILELLGTTVAPPPPVVVVPVVTAPVSSTPAPAVLVTQLIQNILSPAQSAGGGPVVDVVSKIAAPAPVVVNLNFSAAASTPIAMPTMSLAAPSIAVAAPAASASIAAPTVKAAGPAGGGAGGSAGGTLSIGGSTGGGTSSSASASSSSSSGSSSAAAPSSGGGAGKAGGTSSAAGSEKSSSSSSSGGGESSSSSSASSSTDQTAASDQNSGTASDQSGTTGKGKSVGNANAIANASGDSAVSRNALTAVLAQDSAQAVADTSAATYIVTAATGKATVPEANDLPGAVVVSNTAGTKGVAMPKGAAESGLADAIKALTAQNTPDAAKKAGLLQGILQNVSKISSETVVLNAATMSAIQNVLPAVSAAAPAVAAPAVTAPAVTAPAVTAPAVTAPAVTAPVVTAPTVAPAAPSSTTAAPSGGTSSTTTGSSTNAKKK